MKAIITAILGIIIFFSDLSAQNSIDNVLQEVEKNNTSLQAIKKQTEADKIANYTGIYLKNPEVEFNYLFGNPALIGNRTDFSVMQTFDFPTAYSHKNSIANLQNQQSDIEYQKMLNDLRIQTRLIIVDLVYLNALQNEYTKRLFHAQSIANSYKLKMEKGEANILEYNKAQLNLLNLRKESESIEIQRQASLSELATLNGGIAIAFNDSVYFQKPIPADFEQWYVEAEAGSPVLAWVKKEIEISMSEEKLSSAMTLPKISTGYMSENVVGQQFQGLSVGISIPLWENKNTVKYVKAKTIALQSMETDKKLQLYNQLKILHTKAISLQKTADEYKIMLKSYDNSSLLEKAFTKGEISLSEYYFDISMYYESMNKMLETERDLNKTVTLLNQYSN